jgi:hypothetical protein
MEILSEIDYARLESQRADMKQHADKILQGFEKISDAHAIRAIWELVQNARDVSKECEITFDFTSANLVITHNGDPFSSKSIISLIKQVSSKSTRDNEDAVGQFGTGFITTHSFGKKIKLSATIKKQNGKFIHIADFLIDRESLNYEELSSKLSDQQEEIYRIIQSSIEHDEPKPFTVFEYVATTLLEKESVKRASINVDYSAPYVLVLNERIKSIKIINEKGTTTFRKGLPHSPLGGILFKEQILKDQKPIDIFSLKTDEVVVILPLKTEFEAEEPDERMARLFLYFPLMGSERFGFNFIIHSKNFAPTEQRDGIYLDSKNDQTKLKVQENKQLIDEASDLILNYIKKQGEILKNPIVFSKVAFPTSSNHEELDDYFKGLKMKYISSLWNCKLIKSDLKNISVAEGHFFHPDFFRITGQFSKIYKLVKLFYTDIPDEDIAEEWTNIVGEWNEENVNFIGITALVEKIQAVNSLKGLDASLIKHFYEYLIVIEKADLFDKYRLLPNIKGVLFGKADLKLTHNITEKHIQIAESFIPQIPSTFLDPEFQFTLKFNDYYRETLSKDFNSSIADKIKEIERMNSEQLALLAPPIFQLCSIFANEFVNSARRSFLYKACELMEIPHNENFIAIIETDKFDCDYYPFRLLSKIFFRKIAINAENDPDWIEHNLSFLEDSYSLIYKHASIQDLFEASAIIPNQKFKLRAQAALLVEYDELQNETDSNHLKDLYEKIVEAIREKLVLPAFKRFISHTNYKTSLEMSSKIEDQFKIRGAYDNIDDHVYKKEILDIIQRISDNKKWSDLFTSIDDKKAVIMMAKISNPEVKDDLFKIIGLEDNNRIKLLSTLSKVDNLEQLIQLGREALENQFIEKANFQFKYEIGTNIERIIRETIAEHLTDLEVLVDNRQGGQDIVIKLGNETIYFIEVKSRWNTNSSILMSALQIKRALLEQKRYALCSIDMTDNFTSDRYGVSSFEEIEPKTLFVKRIGYFVETLADKVIYAETNLDNLRLTDYKAIVPQSIIKKEGINFKSFMNDICSLIKDYVSPHA